MLIKKYPVVVLHGWKVKSGKYKNLRKALEKNGYKVFVPNMPGNGVEPVPEQPYVLSDYANFIKRYLLTNRVKRCIIIGHSFGGRVGICLAAESPQLVKRLVLTGMPGFRTGSRLRRSLFRIIAKIGKSMLFLPFLHSKIGDYMRKLLYKLAGSYDYNKTDGIMRQTFKNIIQEDMAKLMRKIKSETIIIWGENDRIVPIFVAKKMRKEIQNSKLIIIPNAGHNLPYRNPSMFVENMKR
jgi:pimeloyl-ACP methyl ester carboxylesterase